MRFRLVTAALLASVSLGAQTSHRDSVLTEARYLKSIYRTDDAVELLSAQVQPGAMDEGVLAELADCHFQSGAYEDASGTYFLLSSRFPDNLLYKIRLMQAHYRLKDYPQSIQAGREVLRRDSIPAVVSLVGDAFRQMEQADSALWYYRKSLALKPGSETVVSKAVGILIDRGDYDGAIAQSGTFLTEDPDNTTIAPLQGLAYYRKGDYEAAGKVFQRQEDIGNDTYPIHYYLGQSYWHTLVIYRAERELLAAWQIDSSDVTLAYSIAAVGAECYRPFERDIKPWLDKVEEMTRPDPSLMSRMHQQYGKGYSMQTTQYAKAAEHYKEALKYSPDAIVLYYAIGYCYELNKEFKNALKWYEKYLSVCPKDSRGYKETLKSIEFVKAKIFMEEPKTEK